MVGESVAFVSVGANIEPETNIRQALALLRKETRVLACSTFYRTKPVGRPGQPPFVNGVWLARTAADPLGLREKILQPIEGKLGRRRTGDKFAPRTIDLDLILYDDLVVSDGDVTLPHPDLIRPFVCVPVLELLGTCVADMDGGLQARIGKLIPQGPSPGTAGEELPLLTKQLRDLLSR